MRCAVLGSPIAHSLSPVLHRAAYAELGLDWRYDALEVDEASLQPFLRALGPRWRGLSLTMPLKRMVLPLLDGVSDTARAANAANTVLREPDGRLLGDNTDVPGMCAALAERHLAGVRSALVLGGGATATSAVLALERLGCTQVTIAAREPARAAEAAAAGASTTVVCLAEVEPVDVDLVVSTIPAVAHSDDLQRVVAGVPVLFDVIYEPWPTPLAEAHRQAGKTVVGGLDLLVHQAVLQVELMTGVTPAPLAAMRAAGERALRERCG